MSPFEKVAGYSGNPEAQETQENQVGLAPKRQEGEPNAAVYNQLLDMCEVGEFDTMRQVIEGFVDMHPEAAKEICELMLGADTMSNDDIVEALESLNSKYSIDRTNGEPVMHNNLLLHPNDTININIDYATGEGQKGLFFGMSRSDL